VPYIVCSESGYSTKKVSREREQEPASARERLGRLSPVSESPSRNAAAASAERAESLLLLPPGAPPWTPSRFTGTRGGGDVTVPAGRVYTGGHLYRAGSTMDNSRRDAAGDIHKECSFGELALCSWVEVNVCVSFLGK